MHPVKFLLLAVTACLFACTKMVDVVLPVQQKLALHGYVQVGDHFSATIAKVTRASFFPPDSLLIRNAWMVLYENDVFVDSLKFDETTKKYVSQRVIAALGKTYTIKAGIDGYPAVEARATAPKPVPTVSATQIPNARYDDIGNFEDDIKFSIQDPGDVPNYYLVEVHPSSLYYSSIFCVTSNDPAVEQPRGEVIPFGANACIEPDEILFSDKSFNGTLKTITLSIDSRGMKTITDTSGVYRPYLKRFHMSEEFYRYFKENASRYDSEDPIYVADPISVKGNVVNGYGMFAIYTVTVDTLRQ